MMMRVIWKTLLMMKESIDEDITTRMDNVNEEDDPNQNKVEVIGN